MLVRLLCVCVLVLTACSGNDERAIQHLVVAELIQREAVPESHIEIEKLQINGRDRAIVDAKVLGLSGRSGEWHTVHCDLRKEGGRWRIGNVQ